MADEEKKKTEQSEEQAEGKAPEVEAEEKAPEAEAEEKPAEEAPAKDAPAEEPAADAGGEEGGGEDAPAAGETEDEELEGLDWKARRRLERSRQPSEQRPQRSPEERTAERAERRVEASRRRRAYRPRGRQRRKSGGEGTHPPERDSVARKVRQGTVVSSKADKTITVRVDTARRHPTYEKIVRRSNTLHAHDERNEAGEGDLVRLVETRPLSRTKRWRLAEILEKAQ